MRPRTALILVGLAVIGCGSPSRDGGQSEGVDSGIPDSGPPDSGIPDASVPILTYDSTEAAGCESLRPQLSVPPSVATLREDPAAPCGLPYEADLHGRVIFGCWDSRPDGGPTYKLVESGGRLVRNLAGDVHVEDFIGFAAPDGLIAKMDRPDAGEGAIMLANETVFRSTAAENFGLEYDFEGQLLVVRRSAADQTWARYDDLGTPLTLAQPVPDTLATFGFWALPDVRGNVLTAWQPTSGAALQAQWYGPDLAQVGTAFSLTTTSLPWLQALPGGGFAANKSRAAPDTWIFVLRPGESKISPVPSWRASAGDRAFWSVFSGDAYALIEGGCGLWRWPCPTLWAEILTADGISCGSLRLREPDGSQRPFILTRAGTIIDGVQEILPDPHPPPGGLLLVSRWWPGVLRRP